VFLVDGLLGDAEGGGDTRPAPPELTSALDLEGLELVGKAAQRGYRPQPDGRVAARNAESEFGRQVHDVKISCHSTPVKDRGAAPVDGLMSLAFVHLGPPTGAGRTLLASEMAGHIR
jgi:hypothetical protein